MTRQSDRTDLRFQAQKSVPHQIRKEELTALTNYFMKRLELEEPQAVKAARFCVQYAVSPPALWRLLRDLNLGG